MYFGSVKFIYNNVTVTVQAGINLLGDDNLISKNLLSLLGNPRKISERLYELLISALPLEPVLDPAVGFVGFPQAEVFKLDPEARYDAVFGYDFFNFQGKDLLRSAQRWHVVYEEFAMARLKAELSEKPVRGRCGLKHLRLMLILISTQSRYIKKTNSTLSSLSESVDHGTQDHT